jgi:hypothetical protein
MASRHIRDSKRRAACGAIDVSLVIAAMESDCDACRTAVGVGGVNDKLWNGKTLGVSPGVVPYKSKPYPKRLTKKIS